MQHSEACFANLMANGEARVQFDSAQAVLATGLMHAG